MLKGMRYRDRIICFLALALMVAVWGLIRAPHTIDVYQAPDPRYGKISEQNEVPPTSIYGFAEYIFSILHTWTEDGEIDYKNNGSKLNAYLTPSYFREIFKDAETRSANNELKGRTRIVTVADGAAYSDSLVRIKGPDAWVVYLDMRVEERVDNNIVKDTYVRYPLRVVRKKMSRQKNPWQLALDGYESTPIRLQSSQAAKTAKR